MQASSIFKVASSKLEAGLLLPPIANTEGIDSKWQQ